jgi:hypothetical protein
VHQHDSPEVNSMLGSWFVEIGRHGQAQLPAAGDWRAHRVEPDDQGMGVYPDADGHQCIADAEPYHRQTPLKWKLGYGEASTTDYCQ